MAARKVSQLLTLLATAFLPFLLIGAVNWPAIARCAEEADAQDPSRQDPTIPTAACSLASEHLLELSWVRPALLSPHAL